jgi:hypothetical protein
MVGTAIAQRFDMIAANFAAGLLGRMDEAKIMFIPGTGFLADAW